MPVLSKIHPLKCWDFAKRRCFPVRFPRFTVIVPDFQRNNPQGGDYPELLESYKRGAATGLADVSNALYESAMSGTPVAQIFYLKNRAPNEWADVQSVNKVQINFSRMSDTQLLNELREDPGLADSISAFLPELKETQNRN